VPPRGDLRAYTPTRLAAMIVAPDLFPRSNEASSASPADGAPGHPLNPPDDLSRYDTGAGLFTAFGDKATAPPERRFWHPGVGAWAFEGLTAGALGKPHRDPNSDQTPNTARQAGKSTTMASPVVAPVRRPLDVPDPAHVGLDICSGAPAAICEEKRLQLRSNEPRRRRFNVNNRRGGDPPGPAPRPTDLVPHDSDGTFPPRSLFSDPFQAQRLSRLA